MVLKRSAPARRCARAAVSSGSTATGDAWGWRERNVKVRSSAMAESARTTTSTAAPRSFFMVREAGAAPHNWQGPLDACCTDPQYQGGTRDPSPWRLHAYRQCAVPAELRRRDG